MAFRTPFRPLYTLTNYDVYCELNFTATKYVLQKRSEWWRMFSGQTQIPRRYKPGHGPLIRCEKHVVWIDSWHESYIFSSNENSLSRGTKKIYSWQLTFQILGKAVVHHGLLWILTNKTNICIPKECNFYSGRIFN